MIKKIVLLITCFFVFAAHCGPVANVEYIHSAIKQKWGVAVPYNPNLSDTRVAANMKYLLTAVDVANEILNGEKTTDYSSGEFATMVAADTIATDTAVDTLIKQSIAYHFTATTTDDTTEFSFDISAAGEFYIDWGDGQRQTITKPLATFETYSHSYNKAGKYDIKLGGIATAYPEYGACISFFDNQNLAAIDGSLGAIFPTLPDGTNPSFSRLFLSANSLSSIPEDLFAGLHGEFSDNMFELAFAETAITSIPRNLFADLTANGYASSVFDGTFAGNPITTIPENLFSNVVSLGGRGFRRTFDGTKITSIPEGLFKSFNRGGLYTFESTFSSTPITSIPENLFEGISSGLMGEFSSTFAYTNITEIPENLFANVGSADTALFAGTFAGTPITSIPENLFASVLGGDSVYMDEMFSWTFSDCTQLKEIPNNLFAGLKWESAETVGYLFTGTFSGCTSLTKIPDNLFGDVVLNLDYDDWMYYGVFAETFAGCEGLTGPSARTGGQYFYEKWPNAPEDIFYGMYSDATGLADYKYIPISWGGLGQQRPEYKLHLTHDYQLDMRDHNRLIMISAAGTYNIDWGDGTDEVIEKHTVGEQWFGHDYTSDGIYTVHIGGQATEYSNDPDLSTVRLGTYVQSDWGTVSLLGLIDIDGCLGCVFPTLQNGSQPRFISTFADAYDLNIDIPSGLFTGVSGAPVDNMFNSTFYFAYIKSIPSDLFAGIQGPPAAGMFETTFTATAITSIPVGLFAGIQGPPAARMFKRTFAESQIESIPSDLFAGIQGPPAESMFEGTFEAAFNLASIPDGLFAGIQGPPAENMFKSTFAFTFNVPSIPSDLFAGIDTTKPVANGMFTDTFNSCFSLTGPSARINGRYLYDIWPDARPQQVSNTYLDCEGLSDYNCIPSIWGGGGKNCLSTDPT